MSCENLAKQAQNFIMKTSVIHKHIGSAELKRPAAHSATFAARFLHQQDACRHIPGIQAELPKCFQTAAGHVREIDGRRAAPPDSVSQHAELMGEMNIDIQVALSTWKSGGDQGIFEFAGF